MGTTALAETPSPAGNTMRRSAFAAGALYLVTFVTSIPTLRLYAPVREHADFVLGVGNSASVRWGALLEVVLALACAGTAVALFPATRRHSVTAAIGFVCSRLLEAGLILAGVVGVLAVVALRHDGPGAATDSAALVAAGRALWAIHDETFLLGQSLMPVINALFLGAVLYRSGLVPRIIPLIGLCAAPLLLASDLAIFGGVYAQGTALAGLAALPIALWEFALGMWLVLRGFRVAT
ncbi:DUF4386 domain-containing protein [Nocardia sp. alder85J]|uniref:DUF4386 domain-containing protein n=1 Tax=Nocardia sp. alder85J TaxID=2862949 RepID=UPI001CD2ABF7|nr:DUF4386 domain-containing protein [Nocardia sp. alder85J]MCX4099179.1 DUF4386 domain-containing protein [Nocardia sp. alder85J]